MRSKGSPPRTNDVTRPTVAATAKKKEKKKRYVPWLSSSRGERHVLQYRCQPTPTQPIHIKTNNAYIGGGGWGGGGYSLVACLCHSTIDYASLSRRSTVPTPNRDTSNTWAVSTFFPSTTQEDFWIITHPYKWYKSRLCLVRRTQGNPAIVPGPPHPT